MDMQKLAETKNAGLLAFNGAVIFTVIKLLIDNNLHEYLNYYLYFTLLCALISIALNFFSLSAQLKHKQLEISNHKSENLLFFGKVADHSPSDYLKNLSLSYNIELPDDQYTKDLASQIVINAQIALRKFKLFNFAFKWTIAGIASPLSLLFYYLFWDNNK